MFDIRWKNQILCGSKECKKLHTKRYYRAYYKKNRQKFIDAINKYQKSAKGKKKIKAYTKKNKEAIKLRHNIYQRGEKYKSYKREYMKAYFKTPEGRIKKRLYAQKRRDWKSQIIHDFTNEEWIAKVKSTKGICPSCNENVGYDKLQLDHIIPLSKSKKKQVYTINDIQPLCKECNLRNRFYQIRFI